MDIDLTDLSRQDLLQLQSDVQKALKDAEKRDRRKARAAAERAAADYGYSLDSLVEISRNPTGRPTLPPKYCNPENPEQTWTGRGRRPHWLQDALANGSDLSEFEI